MGDDPSANTIVLTSNEAQIERAILNIKAVLEFAGLSLDKVISRRIFLHT